MLYGKQLQYPYINEVIITGCVKTAIFSIEKVNFLCSIKISDNFGAEIDTISRIVEYYNIKCSSVWYHFDPITVYYKENTLTLV
jgi:hypothetical protein